MSCPSEIRDVLKDVAKMPICLRYFHPFRTVHVQLSHNRIFLYLFIEYCTSYCKAIIYVVFWLNTNDLVLEVLIFGPKTLI